MKHSTLLTEQAPPNSVDVPRIVRGKMAEEQLSASDLTRMFGGAVTYWTRRLTGLVAMSPRDLALVAWATRTHQAEFMGGQPPAGWVAPEPPRIPPVRGATMDESARSSTDRASDYGSVVRLPLPPSLRPVLSLIRGGAA